MKMGLRPRHGVFTRLWHWANFAALAVLFMSGLNISNAHRFLYWGDYGYDPADAWTSVMRFPGWATLPGHYDLAAARDWHSLAAWPFAIGLLVIWLFMLTSGRFWREIATSPKDWGLTTLTSEVLAHIRGKFARQGAKYNALQRITYGTVYGILLPMMVFTGLAISPGIEPALPWLVDLLGGRQSARSLHFIIAWAVFGFFVLHLAMVLVSKPLQQITAMIVSTPDEESRRD